MKGAFALSLVALLLPSAASSYEESTHRGLTIPAIAGSTVVSFLGRLGLATEALFAFDRPTESTPSPELLSPDELILRGAVAEDSLVFLRSLNHFYDPIRNRGLTAGGMAVGAKSPDWALEDAEGGTHALQEHSFRDAREALYAALTRAAKDDRDIEFGQALRALGQIVHHLQDMAQPQHVRNDAHCGFYCLFMFPSSFFEKWTVNQSLPVASSRLPFLTSTYPLSGSGGAMFPSARSMWTNSERGIADFTNRNFVSAGTNFDRLLDPRVQADSKYFLPAFVPEAHEVEVSTECNECPPGVSGRLVFYSTVVDDAVTGTSAPNPRASTESILDERLKFRGMTPAFSLNRFNHAATLDFLGPRAIAYSTGMLNYFFRGDISMEPDPDAPGSWVIVNNGPEAMSGTFALYYDHDIPPDVTANRRKHVEWQKDIPAGGRVSVGSVAFPTNPAPAKVGEFMLVFNGTMGSEGPGSSAVGAVAGRKVDLGPVLVFAGFRDDDPDHDGYMELNLFLPSVLHEAIKASQETLKVQVGEAVMGTSAHALYPGGCFSNLGGECLFNYGSGQYPLEWDTTLTAGGRFLVRSPYTVLFRGDGPADLDLVSNATLCGNIINASYLALAGFPLGAGIPVKVSLGDRMLFEFTVSPPAADYSVVLSGTKNIAVTANRCRVTLQ